MISDATIRIESCGGRQSHGCNGGFIGTLSSAIRPSTGALFEGPNGFTDATLRKAPVSNKSTPLATCAPIARGCSDRQCAETVPGGAMFQCLFARRLQSLGDLRVL